jgi:hypothetical protein
MKKQIFGCAVLCILAATLYSGCKKETNDTPANLSVSPAAALPETFITLQGTDIQDIVSIKFDTTTASFSSVFNTPNAIFTNVPTNPKFGRQVITITNRAGKIATVDFDVLQPAPLINSFLPSNAPEGDTVTITGRMFTNISAVYIGNVKAIITDSLSRTQLKIKIPAGAASGLLSIVTLGGTAYSASLLTVGERALLVADFDGAGVRPNGSSWYSYGDMNMKTVASSNPNPKNGNFYKASPNATSSAGYAGISTYALGSGAETFSGLTSTTAATKLKFDVNNNGKTGTMLQVIVQETTTDNNANNYAKTIAISGTDWNTITIPLTELFNNYGGGTLNPTPANITKVKFHFTGYNGVAMEANIDNVRFAY